MTRREKGPTCISNLADQSQSHQTEAPNFGLYPLSTLYSDCRVDPLRKLFGILLCVENVVIDENGGYYSIFRSVAIYRRCLVPATRCKVRNGRLALSRFSYTPGTICVGPLSTCSSQVIFFYHPQAHKDVK